FHRLRIAPTGSRQRIAHRHHACLGRQHVAESVPADIPGYAVAYAVTCAEYVAGAVRGAMFAVAETQISGGIALRLDHESAIQWTKRKQIAFRRPDIVVVVAHRDLWRGRCGIEARREGQR